MRRRAPRRRPEGATPPLIAGALAGRHPRAWQKLALPRDVKPEFLRRLRAMNITARAFFPGLDGFGRSIRELVRLMAQRAPGPAAPMRLARI